MFKFEKLDLWQKAVVFADVIYSRTKSFPSAERFGLTNQIRRASVSVSSNIAEGSAGFSETAFAAICRNPHWITFRSGVGIHIGKRAGVLDGESFAVICKAAEEEARMLSGLSRTLLGNNG